MFCIFIYQENYKKYFISFFICFKKLILVYELCKLMSCVKYMSYVTYMRYVNYMGYVIYELYIFS